MTTTFLALTAVQVVLGTAVPLALASLWLRRVRARGGSAHARSFGLGALVFILSQVVHVPLNSGLTAAFGPSIAALEPTARIWTNAAVLGLSAGLCEELARYFFFYFCGLGKGPSARERDEAVLVGLGHGGIESILFGTALVAFTVAQLVAIERAGVASLGLDEAGTAAVEAQLAAIGQAPWWSPLMGAGERVMAIAFHVSATMLVACGVVRRRFVLVVAAVLWHAVLDGGMLVALESGGIVVAEAFVLATVPVSVVIGVACWRALPPVERPADPAEMVKPSGAPLELALATKRYGGDPAQRAALEDASFALKEGTRTCLLGVNGAGKTTTLRLALGALKPTSGRAWLYGAAHDDESLLDRKRRVGIVPQQPGMYEDLTVRQYLELVQALYGRGDLSATAKRLAIEPLLDRPMAKHSGGEQRRILLAAALLPEPDLLVLDEPSAGLDPLAQRAIRKLLAEVTVGKTLLLCTHDLDEAEALAERVVILDRGRLKLHEPIEALRRRFPLRLRIVTASKTELERVLRERGVSAETTDDGARIRVAARAEVPGLLRVLLEGGVEVEEAHVEEASLGDIFAATVAGTLPPASEEAAS